jgi:hypothetical protein
MSCPFGQPIAAKGVMELAPMQPIPEPIPGAKIRANPVANTVNRRKNP